MLNLTLVVAGLKELVVDELGGTVADTALFFTVEMAAYLVFAPLWGALSDRAGRRRPFVVAGFAASGLALPRLPRDRLDPAAARAALPPGRRGDRRLVDDDGAALRPRRRSRPARASPASRAPRSSSASGSGAPIGGVHRLRLRPARPARRRGRALPPPRRSPRSRSRRRRAGSRDRRLGEIGRALADRPRLLLPWALYFDRALHRRSVRRRLSARPRRAHRRRPGRARPGARALPPAVRLLPARDLPARAALRPVAHARRGHRVYAARLRRARPRRERGAPAAARRSWGRSRR